MKQNKFKIYFIFEFTDEPKGGAFQFIKALRDYLATRNLVTNSPELANVFFISASHNTSEVLRLKKKYNNKPFVHRIDGPIRLYNHKNDIRDLIVNVINKEIADATIFQSKWSKEKNLIMGIHVNKFETIIWNAPNPKIFNNLNKRILIKDKKVNLIATSWSGNLNKGFDVYQWIDENLDFNKFNMTFIGNSPIGFKNIIKRNPMNSLDLSIELKSHDIFIFPSKIEACSNSLLEALHCGLPVLGFDGSSNTEIIGKGGEVFTNVDEIPSLLETIIKKHELYKENIQIPTLDVVGEKYINFFNKIYEQGDNLSKKINLLIYCKIQFYIIFLKIKNKIFND